MTILLHLGMPKTGSKALQRNLRDHRQTLIENGIIFAEGFRNGGLWHRPMFEAEPDDAEQGIRAEYRGDCRLLYSYEAGYIASDQLIRQISRIAPIHLFIFVRHPCDWFNSFFNQLIKAHRVTYGEILSASPENEMIANYLSVDNHLNRWINNVKKIEITTAPYSLQSDPLRLFAEWLSKHLSYSNSSSRVLFNTIDERDPNPAADPRGLRILIEIKKQLASLGPTELAVAMNYAQNALSPDWQKIREKYNLLTEQEEILLRETYFPRFQKLLNDHGSSAELVSDLVSTRIDRAQLFEPSTDEQQTATELVKQYRSNYPYR